MAIEDQYDAWVKGMLGSTHYTGSASPEQTDAVNKSMRDMQAALDRMSSNTDAAESAVSQVERMNRSTADHVRQMSSELTDSLRQDGLLGGKMVQPVSAPAQKLPKTATFDGFADKIKQQVVGQDAFVTAIVKAFRRPFVMGTTGDTSHARNLMLLCGPDGTGRHYTLDAVVDEMAARGLLRSAAVETIDLSLYPGPAQEKLFLQDLYAALQSDAEVLAFDHYEACASSYLNMVSTLAIEGSLALSSRYVLQRGILVDVGTALAPGAVGELCAAGKYFVFFSNKGADALAERFGARFVDALCGDICTTESFTADSLSAIAGRELNALAQHVKAQTGLAVSMDAAVRDLLVLQYGKSGGMDSMRACTKNIDRALAEYVLDQDSPVPAGTQVVLSVRDNRLMASIGGGEAFDLFSLLPQQFRGDVQAVERDLDEIVGLAEIKTYVRDLAKNVQAQQRRKAQGLKTAALNMHMIFTGNPGTGKTTIARIVSKYLKAIGALSGGQLIEVTRADLVGRYVGHTAPLTNQVIQSALGGVLFIDEAYSLYRGADDSFGLEAIDTLVKGIEDHRDEFVVILAGYTNEMQTFLTSNSGLASRFPNQIEFPDYTPDELWQITLCLAKGKGYRLESSCEMPLKTFFARRQAEDAARNGNGRMARNVLERAILNQSKRLVADPNASLELLEPNDFDLED